MKVRLYPDEHNPVYPGEVPVGQAPPATLPPAV